MNEVLVALSATAGVLRTVLLVGGVTLALIATADWAVRTRRINPFGGVARFMRARVDPRLVGIERQVVRAGGHPSAAPLWALVAYVVAGALLLAALEMIGGFLRQLMIAGSLGLGGMLALVVHWTFGVLRFAIIVRVISSWFPQLARSRFLSWTYGATEWFLRPLRRLIPTIGMIDISPIVAYFALQIVEAIIMQIFFRGVG